jgi:hypothetical protein
MRVFRQAGTERDDQKADIPEGKFVKACKLELMLSFLLQTFGSSLSGTTRHRQKVSQIIQSTFRAFRHKTVGRKCFWRLQKRKMRSAKMTLQKPV